MDGYIDGYGATNGRQFNIIAQSGLLELGGHEIWTELLILPSVTFIGLLQSYLLNSDYNICRTDRVSNVNAWRPLNSAWDKVSATNVSCNHLHHSNSFLKRKQASTSN